MSLKEVISSAWFGDLRKQEAEISGRSDEDLVAHKRGSERLKNLVNGVGLGISTVAFGLAIYNVLEGRNELSHNDVVLGYLSMFSFLRADVQVRNRITAINRVMERRRQNVLRQFGINPLQAV